MIFYFSATGNSRFVAQRVAEVFGEQAVNIEDSLSSGRLSIRLGEGALLGFVTPTYFCGLPHIVEDFLRAATFEGVGYAFAIATYGTTPGQVGQLIGNILADKGITLSARYAVKMPDVWTPTFDLSNPEKEARTVAKEEPQIAKIISHVRNRDEGKFARHQLPMWFVRFYYRNYESSRQTHHFQLTDSCIGCSLCAKKCPAQAIEMRDKRPVWVKPACQMCLGCLHRCPKFAIQYDNKTQKHGQYQHRKYENKN